jgi:hypothetical protein
MAPHRSASGTSTVSTSPAGICSAGGHPCRAVSLLGLVGRYRGGEVIAVYVVGRHVHLLLVDPPTPHLTATVEHPRQPEAMAASAN